MIAESTYGDATSKTRKELQAFCGIIDYLSKFSPKTADVCESLRQLTSVKTERTWNVTYQKPFDKAKSIIAEDVCMKFMMMPSCCTQTQMYLESDLELPYYKKKWYKLPKTTKH